MKELAERPPCGWLVAVEDDDEAECGDPSIATIRVRNRGIRAAIHVCRRHKAQHDESHARLRQSETAR